MSKYEKIAKRHFYNNIHYEIDRLNKVLILKNDFKQQLINKKLWSKFGFKKIGGSFIGDVLGVNKFSTEFKSFAKICWLDLPILDMKYIKAGIIIEPKVRDLIASQKGIKGIITFDAVKYQYDYFKDNQIFGGLPDGLVVPQNFVIEIKTTSVKNKDKWMSEGVPKNYIKQVELYTYLMGLKKFAIVATFLEDSDYDNPSDYNINNRTTKTWFFELNVDRIRDDIDYASNWYEKYIKNGISPQYNEINDSDLLEYLECSNQKEWLELLKIWDQKNKINWSSF